MGKWYSTKNDTYGEYVLAVVFALVVLILVVGLIVAWPLVLIWAVNTLFPLVAIPFTFWTWLAMFVMNLWFTLKFVKFKKD